MKDKRISITAIIISVISIIFSSYVIITENRFEAEWGFLITGVLSFLVTILIAWNIYSVIDFKKEISEVKEQKNEMQSTVINAVSLMNSESIKQSIALYGSLTEFHLRNYSKPEPLIKYALTTIEYQSMNNDFIGCNIMCKLLNEWKNDSLVLRKFEKFALIDIAYRINNAKSIDGYSEFFEWLVNAPTYD